MSATEQPVFSASQMRWLPLTLPTPEENLALDEALLEEAEAGGDYANVLRVWEPARPYVVLGHSSRWRDEVNQDVCSALELPILRRTSGGLSIVTGPGCLMYSLVLDYASHPELRAIDLAHQLVLGRIVEGLSRLLEGVSLCGISDLTWRERKFSGNSLRCKREHLLYHGTLLYDFPLATINAALRMPARQPDYRENRPHEEFVINLPLPRQTLVNALRGAFAAESELSAWPQAKVKWLVGQKYTQSAWNLRY